MLASLHHVKDCRTKWAYPGGQDFETQYKWNPFEKLMIPSNWVHLINYE